MAIPLALQLIAAALPSVVKGVQGIAQTSKAKKMEKGLVRPTYKTPEMINEAIAGARMRAQGTKLPGQKYTEDRLAGATAAGQRAILEAGTGSPGAINAISALYGAQMNKELSLAEAAAQNQQRNQANLQQMLLQGSQYKDKEFQINELDPYKQKAATISALRGAGIQNKAGALSDLSTVALQMMKLNAKGSLDKAGKVKTPAGDKLTYGKDGFPILPSTVPSVSSGFDALREKYPVYKNKTDDELIEMFSFFKGEG